MKAAAIQKASDDLAESIAQFEERLGQLKSTIGLYEDMFNEVYSKGMDAFDVKEQALQIDFEISTDSLNKEIEKAQNEIAAIQYNVDDKEAALKAIEDQGLFITNEGEYETPLIDEKDCAYVIFDQNNIAKCGIEEAYNQGKIKWKKPISCHLYPVRLMEYSEFTAVNYHKWPICDDACVLGIELQVPVYKFVKDAIIRKFGKNWYLELEKVAEKHKLEK